MCRKLNQNSSIKRLGILPVTVAIPVYNCERFLAKAIQNFLNQDALPRELLIVENNSKDAFLNVAGADELLCFQIVANNAVKNLAASLTLRKMHDQNTEYLDMINKKSGLKKDIVVFEN